MGPSGSGKTTFSVSASAHAGDVIGKTTADCSDVVVLAGDAEGVLGAVDAGLSPRVIDFTDCDSWEAGYWPGASHHAKGEKKISYKARLVEVVAELRPLVASGEIKVIVVDLALPSRLIQEGISTEKLSGWGLIANEAATFYRVFNIFKGCTIIGNCQIKSGMAIVENEVAAIQANAKAVGGQRNTYAADLPKGILAPWIENASFVFTREVKRSNGGVRKETTYPTFVTHTISNGTYEAKSRAHKKLPVEVEGWHTLRSLMAKVYGP